MFIFYNLLIDVSSPNIYSVHSPYKYLSCLHTPTIFTINMFPQGVFQIEKWLLRFLLKS
nr:MAG TPA: hypothetical protein [Caudoviricetes sp.]